jgi:hypothetical protein
VCPVPEDDGFASREVEAGPHVEHKGSVRIVPCIQREIPGVDAQGGGGGVSSREYHHVAQVCRFHGNRSSHLGGYLIGSLVQVLLCEQRYRIGDVPFVPFGDGTIREAGDGSAGMDPHVSVYARGWSRVGDGAAGQD